jgi:ubiquinone biosynthesis protein
MATLRDKLMNSGRARAASFAVPRELTRVSGALLRHGVLGLPLRAVQATLSSPALDGVLSEQRLLDLFGDNALQLFEELGPIYGKAGQMLLSRLSPPLHDIARTLRLTRLYKDWPPLSFDEVKHVLDREVPRWRLELRVDPHPLGVASLAQVHAAEDKTGRRWVVKIVKPQARRRLVETVEAMEQIVGYAEPLAVTLTARKLLREMRELCRGFRHELSLTRERDTIERVRDKLKSRRQKTLIIPETHPELCTDDVLVVERFVGTPLSDVVSGAVALPAADRQKLAKSMLSELLVQVFELGLFHADPHAGNLILLESGGVGLFDWGLSGELLEGDRRHIAAILRAVIALDLEQLIDALIAMGEEEGITLERDAVRKELGAVVNLVKKGQREGAKKPTLQQLFEACLRGASRLGLTVPDGLLMMAKSLITIEGLARGIDPDVSMARAATPVLLKAARPGLTDLLAMGRRLPAIARQLLGR